MNVVMLSALRTCSLYPPPHPPQEILMSVITGLWISSIKYNSRRDGTAISTEMTAGTIVQIVSIICLSKINLFILNNSDYCVKHCCDDY